MSEPTQPGKNPAPRKRGFALLGPEQRAKIASAGGTTAHRLGVAHRFTPEEAVAAGRKGGLARRGRA